MVLDRWIGVGDWVKIARKFRRRAGVGFVLPWEGMDALIFLEGEECWNRRVSTVEWVVAPALSHSI